MNILYVTPLWSGLEDVLVEGKLDARGMPAFINPLKRLIEMGHEVDIVIAGTKTIKNDMIINAEWLKQSKIYVSLWEPKGLKKIISIYGLCQTVRQVLKDKQYDFIYGHGSIGSLANIIATARRITCGIRLYGTFLAPEIYSRSRISIAIRHPLEYLSFVLPKRFLLITNDGTRGDLVYYYLNNNRNNYAFHFLLNGVDKQVFQETDSHFLEQIRRPFLFFPARIDRWKRQHLAIDLLKKVYDHGIIMNLYFAGHKTDSAYWQEIEDEVAQNNLDHCVRYLGVLDKQALPWFYRHAAAVLSLYDLGNLGNVVIEALSHGAIVISLNDGSLNNVVFNGENGFLVDNMDEAVDKIVLLMNDEKEVCKIRENAVTMSAKLFMDWNARSDLEIQLIAEAVKPDAK